jgi:hypothetical protein
MGETSTNHVVSDHFKQGMEELPEMLVITMTFSAADDA